MSTHRGQIIQRQRKAMGLSRTKLAERVGCVMESVKNWEQRGATPLPAHAQKLAEILNIGLSEILPELKPSVVPAQALGTGQPPPSTEPIPDGKRPTHSDGLTAAEVARELVAKVEPALRGIQLALQALGQKKGNLR